MTSVNLAQTANLLFAVTVDQITPVDYRVKVEALDERLNHRQGEWYYGSIYQAYKVYSDYVEDLTSRERTLIQTRPGDVLEIESALTELYHETAHRHAQQQAQVTLAY
jgi:hypothetical protein